MDIRKSKNISTGSVSTEGGSFHLGDNYYKSLEYKQLKEREEELSELLTSTRDDLKRLKYSQRLNETRKQIKGLKKEVISLAEAFEKIPLDSERIKLARADFEKGAFKEARAILDAEKMSEELESFFIQRDTLEEKTKKNKEHLKSKADEFLILAKLTSFEYGLENERFTKAEHYFQKSLSADRNFFNLFEFALFLQYNNQPEQSMALYYEALAIAKAEMDLHPYSLLSGSIYNNLAALLVKMDKVEEAEKLLAKALIAYRILANENQNKIVPALSVTLNNLGSLQYSLNKYYDAEISYKESIEIAKKIEKPERQQLYNLGQALNNLGSLQIKKKDFKNAEKFLQESLEITKDLLQEPLNENNDLQYVQNLVLVLRNLGTLNIEKNEVERGEDFYTEALKRSRELAESDPFVYLPELATTLNEIGNFYDLINDYAKAKESYLESLTITRQLAGIGPQSYLPGLGKVLFDLAIYHTNLKEYDEAEKMYDEASEIRRRLAKDNPLLYAPKLADTLNNLGILMENKKAFDMAEKFYLETLEIRTELANLNPNLLYVPRLAEIQITLSNFYQRSKLDRKLSLQLANDAMANLTPIRHIPSVANHLALAFDILKDWRNGSDEN
jgi:tetratricopeptide (TPR) repeat protein